MQDKAPLPQSYFATEHETARDVTELLLIAPTQCEVCNIFPETPVDC